MPAPDTIILPGEGNGPIHVLGDLTDGSTPVVFPQLDFVGMDGGTPARPIYESEDGSAELSYGNISTGWRLWNETPEAEWQSPGSEALSPFDVATNAWTNVALETGAPILSRALPPGTLDLGDSASAVSATLTTALTGTNNDLVFTSALSGRLGNDVRVRYVNPGTNNAALSVSVSGRDITVNLATNGSAVITSTAALVEAAIEASTAATSLVTVANASANDGSGVVTAIAYTALSGGTGGLPLPPDTISL